MTRKRGADNAPMEQDSFLDIVANLVGILIILVVVFGTQIGQTLSQQSNANVLEAEQRLQSLETEWHTAQREEAIRESEYLDWQQTLDQQQVLIEQQRLARHVALQRLAQVQQALDLHQSQLTEQQRQQWVLQQRDQQLSVQLAELNDRIHQVQQATLEIIEQERVEPKVIEHYPTPIAQTVFGQEVHFQLREQKLLHVPFDELVQRLRATWETHAENLPLDNTTTETIGPIGAFRLQYQLVSESKFVPTPNGPISTRVVSLNRFWLLPVAAGLGESFEQAQGPQSEYRRTLGRFSPVDTTVSIWVYPESYATFLEVRKQLVKDGYRVAVWPLTAEQKISGSPHGLRPTAQ